MIFKNLRSFCQKICGFKKKSRIIEKKSRIDENFFVKKLLTRQKIRSFVTLGKMLPQAKCYQAKCYLGKLLPRQNVTRQVVTRQNVTRQIVTRQNVAEPAQGVKICQRRGEHLHPRDQGCRQVQLRESADSLRIIWIVRKIMVDSMYFQRFLGLVA